MKKFTVLMVLLFVSMTGIMAQTIADYIYSTTTNGSLVDMSSGTTNLLTGYNDDTASAVTNIGFTFKLGATTYTQFSVNSNGQMQLGATVITRFIAMPSPGLACLAPIHGDNVIQSTGKIHYKLEGATPNQKLIVEWKNLYIPYANNPSTGTFSTVQAVLYETSDKVEYIYGSMYNNSTSTASRGVFISTSNVAGSVGNIITINTSPTWNVTAASVTTTSFAASSAMTNLNSSADGFRRVFSFLPPDPTAVPNAAISPSPVNNATGISLNPVLTWFTGGGVTTDYDVYFGTVEAGLPAIANANVPNPTWTPTGPFPYSTAYIWKVVPHNANGYCTTGITNWTFTTMADPTVTGFPYEVGFENAGALPANWTATEAVAGALYHWAATTADALHSASSPHSGTYFAYLNSYSASVNYNPYYLNSPPIALDATAKRLSYWYYIGVDSGDTPLSVEISSDNLSWTSLYAHTTTSNTGAWYQNALSLGTYASSTVYIRFSGISNYGYDQCNFAIDDVKVEDIPAAPIFSYSPTSIYFGEVTQVVQTGPQNVTITNTGDAILNIAATDISLIGTNAAQFSFGTSNLPAALGAGQSVVIPLYLTAASQYAISATLRIVNSQSRTDYDVALSAWGLPEYIVVIGNGTSNLNLPINPFFAYGYSQSIFLQSEIARADQRIEKLFYYRNGTSEVTSSSDWTIYMGHTALTAFDTTTSWIPLASLSQVFTGTVPLPATHGWLEIPLDVPFVYNNTDNLVIAVDENAAGSSGSYSRFFDSTDSATNRSIHAYSDNANPNPSAPPAGTLRLGYPNVRLQLGVIPVGEPEAVSLTAPADGAFGLPKAGFELTWIPSLTGGIPTSYVVYMASDEDTMFEENSWVTTSHHFNPVTQGSFTFDYLDQYFWTVKAVNAYGDATADPARSFEIEADSTIPVTVFPYTMDFEANGDNSSPNRWTRSSLGVGWLFGDALWSDFFDIPDHTVYAAANDDAADAEGTMDLLYGPHFDFSGAYAGIPILSFDSFYSGDFGQIATVEISTNGLDWTVLKTLAANPAWVTLTQSLADYDGMSDVQLRFHADDGGEWASGWAIDNFAIDYFTIDWLEPVVDHYPIIGVPLLNTDIEVVADITDELTWNSGISSATLHYTLDGGAVVDVPMTGVGSVYSAPIPGQAAGTLVAYYLTAADASAQLNAISTPTWDFYIDSPVWLQYDSNTISTYLGPIIPGDFGIMTGFENPFGAGNPCQINSVFARSLNAATGNIHVYTYDSGSDTFTDVMPSFAQSFLEDTDTVIPLTGCVTTAGYYYVAITDVAGANYFALDETQAYYPDTHFVMFGAGMTTADLGTVEDSGFAGSWLLRANVQAGSSGLDTPVVAITDGPTLAWSAVAGANSYKVYGSANPYATFWTLLTTTGLLTYTNATLGNTHFFKVVAVNDAPPTKNAAVTHLNKLINNGSKRAAQAPKATIKLKNRN